MKILIHRGAHEIGGTCIQLSTDNTTILLDLGLPLSKDSMLLDVAALKPDAVLISHPHQDHYGLIDLLSPEIPIYIGELGKHLIDATRKLIGSKLHTNDFQHFKSWESFTVGDFVITPYLVDHSAVDAYGFLIEAEGKRLFYSGDFRAHGRKSVLFDKMIKNPPKDIDMLFMEGTMIDRNNDEFPTEADVEQKIYETIRNQENITYIISSSQNIDRIVSAFRACKRSGKTLVIDIYTAWVLEQIKLVTANVPSMEWEQVKVYASYSQDNVLKDNSDFFGDFRNRIYKYRVHKEELYANPENYLFFGKMSHYRNINVYKKVVPVNVIYSQWLGYLSYASKDYFGAEEIAAYQNDPQVNFIYAHTSGHATVTDLKKFAAALKPKMLVPVHTEKSVEYCKLFENVLIAVDGKILNLRGACVKQSTVNTFKRLFDEAQQKLLSKKDLYKNNILKDIKAGVIFPAIRNNTIDFYYKGGNAFHFNDGKFSTHIKYASVLQGHKKPYINDEEITKAILIDSFISGYDRIKENCSLYSGIESASVAKFCALSSFARSSEDNIVVLDIEVSLQAIEDELDIHLDDKKRRSQDRIDILLLNKQTRTLQFVEAKHFSNKELWAEKNKKPKVVDQINRYKKQISKKSEKHVQIVDAYNKYIDTANTFFNLTPPIPTPVALNEDVILLVFGFDNNQKQKIQELLKDDGSLEGITARFIGTPKKASDVWK